MGGRHAELRSGGHSLEHSHTPVMSHGHANALFERGPNYCWGELYGIWVHPVLDPPSTGRSAPVMYSAPGEQR